MVDLRALDLRAVDLRAVDLRVVDLRVGVDLRVMVGRRVVDLRVVDFRVVDFRVVDFRVVDLRVVDLRIMVGIRVVVRVVDLRVINDIRVRMDPSQHQITTTRSTDQHWQVRNDVRGERLMKSLPLTRKDNTRKIMPRQSSIVARIGPAVRHHSIHRVSDVHSSRSLVQVAPFFLTTRSSYFKFPIPPLPYPQFLLASYQPPLHVPPFP